VPSGEIPISELDAIYHMVSSVFAFETKYIECSLCAYPHLDKDWFSVHGHQRHLCSGCGNTFRDSERAIGNPIAKVREVFTRKGPPAQFSTKRLDLTQSSYTNGLQIWGSNPAILWTASRAEEEGIHIHAFGDNGALPVIDDTFCKVRIDGFDLDAKMLRVYMAQSALPHLANRIKTEVCPRCGEGHFDDGDRAYTPHEEHLCENCGKQFRSEGKIRKIISNPIVSLINKLAKRAPRTPQIHKTRLLPETM
jgi:transposase-like protein